MPDRSHHQVSPESLADIQWLVSDEAVRWLDAALRLSASATSLQAAEVERLRRELSRERTHLVLELAALRQKARAKFSAAERMFFTPLGLEQATDEVIGGYKARRFAGADQVIDLCSGIGGDLAALAEVCRVVGYDRDPRMAVLAEANLRAIERADRGTALVAEGSNVDVGDAAAWHIDPDRRPTGRRTTHVELHDPTWQTIETMLARNNQAAVKLSPATTLEPPLEERAELEWISRARECRQLVAWFGHLANDAGRRRATVLGAAGEAPRSVVGVPGEPTVPLGRVEQYLYEPDPAVLAAKLDGTLAAEHELSLISSGIAYYTAAHRVDDAALACFEVRDVLPFQIKTLKALVRQLGIGRLEIKKRGVDNDPERLRKELQLHGDASATLLVTRIAGRVTAIIAERIAGSV